jgi:serine/threonine protein phosphatase PrpC
MILKTIIPTSTTTTTKQQRKTSTERRRSRGDDQHLRHHQGRRRLDIIVNVNRYIQIAVGCLLVIFTINFVVLVVVYIPQQHREKHVQQQTYVQSLYPNIQQQQPSSPRSISSRQDHPHNQQEQKCPSYGCPIYPLEVTVESNETIRNRANRNRNHQGVVGSSSSSSSYACLSKQGKSHTVNQDRAVIISPFLIDRHDGEDDNSNNSNNNNNNNMLVAIFDGHGELGHTVAQRAVTTFPQLLSTKLNEALNGNNIKILLTDKVDTAVIKSVLNETFVEVDRTGIEPDFYLGGTTATVALRLHNTLFLANAGDSQTIVVSCTTSNTTTTYQQQGNIRGDSGFKTTTTSKVEYTTIKDKPNLPEEHDRITKMGGMIGPKGGRVIVHSTWAHDTIGLAMSRSIGDWEWGDVGVIPQPRISVIDLEPYIMMKNREKQRNRQQQRQQQELFVISASDGIWDHRRPEFYARQFCDTVGTATTRGNGEHDDGRKTANHHHHDGDDDDDPFVLVTKLLDVIDAVTPTVGYQDDMTAAVVKLNLVM